MKWFKTIMIILVLGSLSLTSDAKADPEVENLKLRLKNLEDYKSNIQTLSDVKAENLKKYIDDEIKKGLDTVEESNKYFKMIAWAFPCTVVVLIGVLIYIAVWTKRLVSQKIAEIVEEERNHVLRLIQTEASDNKLRCGKQLLVISGDEESSDTIKAFLKRLKFKKVIYRIVGEFDEIPEHDLMIFNTPKGQLGQDVIDKLMEESDDEDHHYVAYSTERITPKPRLNFSNSLFTLYHNILSTLRYSEIARLIEED